MGKTTFSIETTEQPANQEKIKLDLVIDANVMRLYSEPKDLTIKKLFIWLYNDGSLAISHAMLNEYNRHGNKLIFGLIQHLTKNGRITSVTNDKIKNFTADKKIKYTCNPEDIEHAKLVFLSIRKKLISFDDKLVNDINSAPKISKIKPSASNRPIAEQFYL